MDQARYAQLIALEKRLGLIEERASANEEAGEQYSKHLVQVLRDMCNIVRESDESNASNLDAVVEKAAQLMDKAINVAYNVAGFFDFMPSFAHRSKGTLVEDSYKSQLNHNMASAMMPLLQRLGIEMDPKFKHGTWSAQSQPHPKSTPLSRFRPDMHTSAEPNMPLASFIYQARCEIADHHSCLPINMAISSGGSCMAVTSAGGWKNRDPVVQYFLLDEHEDGIMPEGRTFDPRLSGVARHIILDETRKLIFVADDERVKSFAWGTSSEEDPQAVHTLWSDQHSGPLALLPQDRLVRAGRSEAFVWNLNDLETHGPSMKRIGRGKFDIDGCSRDVDDGDEVELSTGSRPHHIVKFAEKDFAPCSWHLHTPTNRLLASHHSSTSVIPHYGCIAIDLEDEGKTAARYLGHGGQVEGFSTSPGDANLFATAGSDGFARLYDVRHPLPVLTFDAGSQSEFCADVVFVHPDGLPTLFTGGRDSQQIKMWDIRARCAVYDLATGNNEVTALAWDSKHSSLWAATECGYIDRMGYNHDYRRANVPGQPHKGGHHDGDEDGDDEDDYDDDDDALEGDEKLWPTRAYHSEDYFGYMFDAGDHRVYKYAFKEDANPKEVPAYGTASLSSFEDSW